MGIFSRKQNRRTSEQVDDAPPHIPKNTRRSSGSSGSIMMTARKGMKQLTKFVSKKNKKRAFAVLVAVALAAASLAKVNPDAAKKAANLFNQKKTEIAPEWGEAKKKFNAFDQEARELREKDKQEEPKRNEDAYEINEDAYEINEDAYEINVDKNGKLKKEVNNKKDFEECRTAIWDKLRVKIVCNNEPTTYTFNNLSNTNENEFTINLKDSESKTKKKLVVTYTTRRSRIGTIRVKREEKEEHYITFKVFKV